MLFAGCAPLRARAESSGRDALRDVADVGRLGCTVLHACTLPLRYTLSACASELELDADGGTRRGVALRRTFARMPSSQLIRSRSSASSVATRLVADEAAAAFAGGERRAREVARSTDAARCGGFRAGSPRGLGARPWRAVGADETLAVRGDAGLCDGAAVGDGVGASAGLCDGADGGSASAGASDVSDADASEASDMGSGVEGAIGGDGG